MQAAGVAAGIAITLVLCGLMGAALNIIARCCSARPELQSYGSVVTALFWRDGTKLRTRQVRYHFEERYGRKAILVFDVRLDPPLIPAQPVWF